MHTEESSRDLNQLRHLKVYTTASLSQLQPGLTATALQPPVIYNGKRSSDRCWLGLKKKKKNL